MDCHFSLPRPSASRRRRRCARARCPARRHPPITSASCARSMTSPSAAPSPAARCGEPRSPTVPPRPSGTPSPAEPTAPEPAAASQAARCGRACPRRSGPSTACSAPTSTPTSRRGRSSTVGCRRRRRWRPASASTQPMSSRATPTAAGPGRAGRRDWPLAGGGRLHNTGSWVFATAFHHPGTPPSPYWPGTVTWIEDSGTPRRVQLLRERSHEEMKAVVRVNRAAATPR